jgi:hypothetical protein
MLDIVRNHSILINSGKSVVTAVNDEQIQNQE